MRLCIAGPKETGFEEKTLIREAEKRFDRVVYADVPSIRIEMKDSAKIMFGNINISNFDCVLPRMPRTYLNHGYLIAKLLEKKVFMPIKPESIFLSHHKFLTLLKLHHAKIPVPKTYMASTAKAIENVLDNVSYPVVIKLIYGSRGKGVMFADSRGSAISLLDTIESIKQPLFVEEYIPAGHEDIRAVVVGGKVVAAMKRISRTGDRRANIGTGGTGEKVKLSKELSDLAVRSSQILGLGIAGIDIIEPEDPKVIEANVNVNFEGITKYTRVNVAKHIIKYLIDECEKRGG